ncbi:MAG: alpha-mannosidase, partial [Planctomycetota bacterium]|nr:alpha-mannosidase [Planctomycetota bacterium]
RRKVDRLLISPRTDRISYGEAMRLKYRSAKIGEQLGPQWATFWFKAETRVPPEWKGGRVDLIWVSCSEATLWMDGRIVQGLSVPQIRPDAILIGKARGGETVRFAVEVACNQMFGAGKRQYDSISPFVLDRCDIALFDKDAWELYHDLFVLQELEKEQTKDLDRTWGGELLRELNRVANVYDPDDRKTWAEAREILRRLYTRRNGSVAHELSAIGHAHIDSAWLWPVAETMRKCERTFSAQVAYMDEYPEYRFACSQAVQYQWIKDRNPELYARIKEKVKAGQFVPVGGTWVEMDCNIPSGESLARQFLYGQRFFQKEFGITCREFWEPDVFGYNGQLPQIMRQAGINWFLTQKLSWNRFNKPHHHTFRWQGIDGSEVLAHFPPADTYNARCTVEEIRNNARDYKENDRSRNSILLFGYGDGGGGPTKEMIERLLRMKDLQGLPRVRMRSSGEFFRRLEKDTDDWPVIVGELYFEFHRGTYTTQAAAKRFNRKNEFLLHDVEFLSVCAARLAGTPYPRTEVERLWKMVLFNQFHDILPGSSIGLVYEDNAKDHAEVRRAGEALKAAALRAIGGRQGNVLQPVNTIGFERKEVAEGPDGRPVFVEAPPYGIGRTIEAPDQVSVERRDGRIVLENAALRAELSPDGTLRSLVHKPTGRESLAGPGNVFEIYDDRPNECDAWDVDPFHLETRKECPPATSWRVVEESPMRATVLFERQTGKASSMRQRVSLSAGARRLEFHTEVDWRESHKMLKVAFPVNARAMNATYEMQFGCCERPTHYSTPYDLARYEVPGHKWADLSEHGFGVSLLTDCKYGYSTYGNVMRISLLRSPKHPDENADMGRHEFACAVFPHAGGWREAGVVAEAFRFNVPVSWARGNGEAVSFFGVDDPNIVLDTIKLAEDSDSIIVRMYEAHGARGRARLKCAFPFGRAYECNILEEDGRRLKVSDGTVEFEYSPYRITGIRLSK